MKTLRIIINTLMICLFGVLIKSCSYDSQVVPETDVQHAKNFVSLDQASSIASVIEHPLTSNSASRKKGITSNFKEIEKVTEIPDEDGIASYYIINYKDDGFIMIAADNRVNPILAYSESDKFPLDETTYPSGLVEWLVGSKDYIKNVRDSNIEQTLQVASAWETCGIQQAISIIDDDCGRPSLDCKNQYITIGPLLSTVWGQRGVYNDNAPFMVEESIPGGVMEVPYDACPTGKSCCQALTGCVATAMAQVMNFHEFPNNYIWDNMPDLYGTMETAKLMRDIGDAVSMNWGCDSSGADTKGEVASSFKNDFGYSSASYADFNHETVKQELRWGRPVILRGGSKSGWWIFTTYEGGHAWVCDGYRVSTTYSEDCSIAWSYSYLHMNWGWSSTNLNGWYAYNNWNPGGSTYNYKRGMVYNIKP